VLGLIGTSWGVWWALNERDMATTQASKADQEAKAAVAARKEAEDRRRETAQVASFQGAVLAGIDATDVGVWLLEDLRSRLDAALAKKHPNEAERAQEGEQLRNLLGHINATDAAATLIDRTILRTAIETIRKQVNDQPAVDASLRQTLAIAYLRLGLYESAWPLQRSALESRRRFLGDEHRDTLTSINQTGILLQTQGKLDEAEPYFREGLEERRRI